MSIEFVVYGAPAPQGSKKFVGRSAAGHGIMVESSKAVKPWREAVKSAAYPAVEKLGYALEGPLRLMITFTLKKPASAPKRSATYPDKKPDLSKLVRSTEDALTDIGAWEDDSRVVEVIARKVFPGEHPEALPTPGARIRIEAYR